MSSDKKLETRISNYRLVGARVSELGCARVTTLESLPMAYRQKWGLIEIDFQFTRNERIFQFTSKNHFSRSFLNTRTTCRKTSSHFGSDQRFIIKRSILSFQLSI